MRPRTGSGGDSLPRRAFDCFFGGESGDDSRAAAFPLFTGFSGGGAASLSDSSELDGALFLILIFLGGEASAAELSELGLRPFRAGAGELARLWRGGGLLKVNNSSLHEAGFPNRIGLICIMK